MASEVSPATSAYSSRSVTPERLGVQDNPSPPPVHSKYSPHACSPLCGRVTDSRITVAACRALCRQFEHPVGGP